MLKSMTQKMHSKFVARTEGVYPNLESENDYDNFVKLYEEKQGVEPDRLDHKFGSFIFLVISLLAFWSDRTQMPFIVQIGFLAAFNLFLLLQISDIKQRFKIFYRRNCLLLEGTQFEVLHFKYTKYFFRDSLRKRAPLFVKRFFCELCATVAIMFTVHNTFASTLVTLLVTCFFTVLMMLLIVCYNIMVPSIPEIKKALAESKKQSYGLA